MDIMVIKRDGTKVPFDGKKIDAAVTAAATEAGLSADSIQALVAKVSGDIMKFIDGKTEVTTAGLKEQILMDLDGIDPSVSAAWRTYDSTKQ